MSNNMQDLTASDVQRQSVLNSKFAIERIQSELSLGGIMYEGMPVFTKPQVAQILGVDERTVDRYINTHNDELTRNGYVILRSSELNKFKYLVNVGDMGVVEIDPRVPQLGIFKFRAVLNLAMLVTESERARAIRSRILDIVIDVITNRAGGDTKYINQRDVDFLDAAYQEENYRKDFTSALIGLTGMSGGIGLPTVIWFSITIWAPNQRIRALVSLLMSWAVWLAPFPRFTARKLAWT